MLEEFCANVLKWPEDSKKKDVKNLQEQKKALTKIITIQLDQERKGQLEKLTTKIQYLATNFKYLNN